MITAMTTKIISKRFFLEEEDKKALIHVGEILETFRYAMEESNAATLSCFDSKEQQSVYGDFVDDAVELIDGLISCARVEIFNREINYDTEK